MCNTMPVRALQPWKGSQEHTDAVSAAWSRLQAEQSSNSKQYQKCQQQCAITQCAVLLLWQLHDADCVYRPSMLLKFLVTTLLITTCTISTAFTAFDCKSSRWWGCRGLITLLFRRRVCGIMVGVKTLRQRQGGVLFATVSCGSGWAGNRLCSGWAIHWQLLVQAFILNLLKMCLPYLPNKIQAPWLANHPADQQEGPDQTVAVRQAAQRATIDSVHKHCVWRACLCLCELLAAHWAKQVGG